MTIGAGELAWKDTERMARDEDLEALRIFRLS